LKSTKFKSKSPTVLITGASGGLGRSLSIKFARMGYNLIINGRNKCELKKTAINIKKENQKIKCILKCGDLKNPKTIKNLMIKADKYNASILINNAGISEYGSIINFSEDKIRELIGINLIIPLILSKDFCRLLIKGKKKGTIINIISMSGREPNYKRAVYCASKYGLTGFTDSLSLEFKKKGINILGIYPRGMKTKGYKGRKMKGKKLINPDIVAEDVYNQFKNL